MRKIAIILFLVINLYAFSQNFSGGLHGGVVLGNGFVLGGQVLFNKGIFVSDVTYNYSDLSTNGAVSEIIPSAGISLPLNNISFHLTLGIDFIQVQRQSKNLLLIGGNTFCLKSGVRFKSKKTSRFVVDIYYEGNKFTWYGVSKGGNSGGYNVSIWANKFCLGINYIFLRDKKKHDEVGNVPN